MVWLLAVMGLAMAGGLSLDSDSDDDSDTSNDSADDGSDVQRTDLSDIDLSLTGELILGTDGDDRMNGGGGPDLMFGNEGSDLMSGGDDADMLIDDEGSDTLMGDGGDDLLLGVGLLDVDDLQGMFDNPPVTINQLANTIAGSFHTGLTDNDDDTDTLSGGAGDDTLFGGNNDLLIGGAGSDLFVGGEYVRDDAPVIISDYNAAEDVLVYGTEDGEAGNLTLTYEGAPGQEDAIVRDNDRHVMTVRGVGLGFTVDNIYAINQI